MTPSRRAYLGTVAGAAAGLAAGCLAEGDDEGALDLEGERTELLLNWQPSGLHVPYYAAADRGFYEEHGLEVAEIESGQGSDFSATQVALENVPFGVTSSDQVLNVASEGLEPTCVGVLMQRNPVVLFADRDGFGEELEEPAQLEGTTVGSGPGMVRMMSTTYLEHHDVDVEIADAGPDIVQQVLTGEVDAGAGVFSDVVDARHQDATIDVLSVDDDIPSYGHLIATSRTFAEDNPDVVRAFLRGTARGAAWAADNVEGATEILVEAVPELEEAADNQRDKWELLAEEYLVSEAVEENGWGWSDGDVWAETADVLAEHDFLGGAVDSGDVWTNDYLDADYEYIGEFTDETGG
ncbi:ABC transporter substrate-binding protein [Natrononativus amylolyticus]|uniref:ABC transporter substrate-binding protein n=1 Tax=Natrononativus amylolyticus TaxID=2963434 RepID=UPI0020CC2F60|nr:ABC transporter substrate-binding protein [Natrononativus amylolyticus]